MLWGTDSESGYSRFAQLFTIFGIDNVELWQISIKELITQFTLALLYFHFI
ncbi:hypothetical protein ACT691_00900 [Vibrio metschnikovii]